MSELTRQAADRHQTQRAAAVSGDVLEVSPGSRVPAHVRERVGRELAALSASRGGADLDDEDYVPYMAQTGRKIRQLQRYKADAEKLIALETVMSVRGTQQDNPDGDPGEQITLEQIRQARAVLRGERPKARLTERELLALTAAPNIYEAYLFLSLDAKSVVKARNMQKTLFYDLVAKLPEDTRKGLFKGSHKMNEGAPHLPRPIINLAVLQHRHQAPAPVGLRRRPLELRRLGSPVGRRSQQPHRRQAALRPRAVRLRDRSPVRSSHPRLPARPARRTRPRRPRHALPRAQRQRRQRDRRQDARWQQQLRLHHQFLPSWREPGQRPSRARPPGVRHRPQAPTATSRPNTARLKKPYAEYELDDLLTFEQLSALYHELIDKRNVEHAPDTDRHAGRTPAQYAYDLIAQGRTETVPVSDEQILDLAIHLGDRVYDANAGTVQYDNRLYHDPALARDGERSYSLYGLPGDDTFVLVADTDGKYVCTAVWTDLLPGHVKTTTKKDAVDREKQVDKLQKEAAKRFGTGSWAARFASGSDQDSGPVAQDLQFHDGSDLEPDGPQGVSSAPSRPFTAAEAAGRAQAKRAREAKANGAVDDALSDIEPDIEPDSPPTGRPTGRSAGPVDVPSPKTGKDDDSTTASTPDHDTDPDDDDPDTAFLRRKGLL